jgi:hypothetical protein
METFEARRLMSTTAWTAETISEISGDYFGEVLVGDNGNVSGIPTVTAGSGGEADSWTFNTWDSNVDDGFDSEWVGVQFSIGAGQGAWEVSNSGAATFSTGTSPSIGSVTIQAAVMSAYMKMSWQDVTVNFYSGGQLMESVSVADFAADTTDGAGWTEESGVIVAASGSNYDGVVITAQVRLEALEGMYPGPSDIFGQVVIN